MATVQRSSSNSTSTSTGSSNSTSTSNNGTTEPLYSAEQINIPQDLAVILKHYTKAVIRAQPENIYLYSRE